MQGAFDTVSFALLVHSNLLFPPASMDRVEIGLFALLNLILLDYL